MITIRQEVFQEIMRRAHATSEERARVEALVDQLRADNLFLRTTHAPVSTDLEATQALLARTEQELEDLRAVMETNQETVPEGRNRTVLEIYSKIMNEKNREIHELTQKIARWEASGRAQARALVWVERKPIDRVYDAAAQGIGQVIWEAAVQSMDATQQLGDEYLGSLGAAGGLAVGCVVGPIVGGVIGTAMQIADICDWFFRSKIF